MTTSPPELSTHRLELALARERERSRALREVGLLLDSTVPRDELLSRVLAAAARVTEAERATLYLVDAAGEKLVSHATEGGGGGDGVARIVLPMGEGIAGTAARDRKTTAAPDAYGDPRFERAWDQRTGYRTRSVLASPMLTSDGRVVGVLQVLNRRDQGVFDPDDVAMLEALAAQAAVAIEGARSIEATVEQNRALTELRGRLERSLRERDLLLEMEQLLSRTDSLDEFLHGALAGVMRECQAERGAVLLADEPGAPMRVRAARGRGGEASLVGTEVPYGAMLSRVVRTGIAETTCGDGAGSADGSVLPGPARCVLIVPLPSEGGPIGVIELRDRERGPFSPADTDLLTLVAANISTGVELAEARRERERATRLAAVGRTLTNVLHDLRTPMTVISGYAQLMPGVESAQERAKLAQAIVRQFAHVQTMIGELLAFVRGESQLLVSKVLLEPFFTETVDGLRSELATRGVTVKLEVRERGSARFDTGKLTRLVHNLARNAADALAGRGGGTFTIGVDRADGELKLTFEDNGPGIPEAIRRQLFGSFVTEGKPGGTGLGLAIVKKVVDEHGGRLAVETGDWGTRFTVWLPMLGPPPSVRPPALR